MRKNHKKFYELFLIIRKFSKELKKLTRLSLSDIIILTKIGDGEFGQVYKGTLKNEENKEPIPVAIKVNKYILKYFISIFYPL